MRTLIAILLMTGAAAAQESETLEQQAYRCWNIPAGLDRLFASEFDVVLSGSGDVKDIIVMEYDKQARKADDLVRSASRAIQRCSPYKASTSGTVRFVMDPADVIGEEIDPFKPAKK